MVIPGRYAAITIIPNVNRPGPKQPIQRDIKFSVCIRAFCGKNFPGSTLSNHYNTLASDLLLLQHQSIHMQIRELSLRTNNLLATTQFYTQVLGLALLDQTPTSIRLSIGTSTLCFKAIQADHSPQYHFAISIPHNQVVFAIDWMKNRADLLPVDNGLIADFRNWNAEAIYFNDNNGNIVEFIGRRDLDNASGQVFSSDSLLAINEAGIVTPDPLALAEKLKSNYGIPDFSRGPRLPDFTASGTDEGLLIIAQTGRNWYPTSQPAAQEPIQVCLINQGQEIHIHFN